MRFAIYYYTHAYIVRIIFSFVPAKSLFCVWLQEVFTAASQKLFEATKHRIYFGKIKIIVPKTWTTKPEYTNTPQIPSLASYISVDNGKRQIPRVLTKSQECGKPGLFMYLHTEFLLNEGITTWGPHGMKRFHSAFQPTRWYYISTPNSLDPSVQHANTCGRHLSSLRGATCNLSEK